jgi:hypothetical protein
VIKNWRLVGTMSKKYTKQERRIALSEDLSVDSKIAERGKFISYLRRAVPDLYRSGNETKNCLSAIRNYFPVSGENLNQVAGNINKFNQKLRERDNHLFGYGGNSCQRCLRISSAFMTFIGEENQGVFNNSARALIDFEAFRKLEEGRDLGRGLSVKGDGLYLIGVETYHATKVRTNKLIFYGDWSLAAARDALVKRIENSGFDSLRDFEDFGNIIIKLDDNQRFYRSKAMSIQGKEKTIVEIVSKD